MATMEKIFCKDCEFEAYSLTEWHAITLACRHESKCKGHVVAIATVPFNLMKYEEKA